LPQFAAMTTSIVRNVFHVARGDIGFAIPIAAALADRTGDDPPLGSEISRIDPHT
jgi:hypothetical protein